MAKKHPFWSRVFTFVPTPMKNDGETIDEDGLRRVLDHQIDNGIDGVCVFGSTGGNGSFTEEEMMRGTEVAARHIDGRISVEHYERVAGAIDVPICVYNNPWTTGIDMPPEFLAKLATFDNIDCVKESTGDLTRISQIRHLTNDDVALIAGWESTSLQAFAAGATGWAPVVTNFLPNEAMAFFRAAVYQDDLTESQTLWDRLFPICDIICTKSHVRVGHTGLDILGRPVGPPRRPLRMLTNEDRTALAKAFDEVGAIAATTKAA